MSGWSVNTRSVDERKRIGGIGEVTLQMKRSIVLVCHSIIGDENRIQFKRTKFLCEAFETTILSVGEVSEKARNQAFRVAFFPLKAKHMQWLFVFWCIWKISQIRKGSKLGVIWTTYQPRIIISGFICSRILGWRWVADIWDDPAKSLLITRYFYGLGRAGAMLWKKMELAIAKYCLRKADMVVTTLGDRLPSAYRVPTSKIVHVTSGIDLSINYPSDHRGERSFQHSTPVLFYCGTVDQVRLEGLVPALRTVLKIVPRLRVIVVGHQLNEGYKWLMKSLEPLQGRVVLENKQVQPFKEVVRLIGEADVCLCPYPAKLDLIYAIPVKLLEYMACGRAIVASDLPGVRRILEDGVTGLLFRPGDYQEMAEKVVRLIKSPGLRAKLGNNAREAARAFDWTKIHNELYLKVVSFWS